MTTKSSKLVPLKAPMKMPLMIAIAVSIVITSSTTALAADGKALYESKGCAACHGADANTPIMPLYPKIAGQTKEYTIQQLKDFKSGARSNGQSATMKGVLGAVSDEESAAIAEFLAGL